MSPSDGAVQNIRTPTMSNLEGVVQTPVEHQEALQHEEVVENLQQKTRVQREQQ